jgi:amidohydrolase
VDGELEFLRRVRRAIHRRPELGHQEIRTANLIERTLRLFDLDPFRPATTSVAVVAGPSGLRPAVGLRADIDALPIDERTGAPYASRNRGVMHACGHDGHTATLLALARRLAAEPPDQAVLLVFQQAEEADPSGAPLVIDGIPESLMPAEFYGFHLWPELAHGVVGVRPGSVLAAVAGLVVTVSGDTGRVHGTWCDAESADALAAGVALYQDIRETWPGRHLAGDQASTVTVGQLTGGNAPNRVATSCLLRGAIRSLSWAEEKKAVREVTEMAARIREQTGAQFDIDVRSGIRPPVSNDPDAVAKVRTACRAAGVDCLDYPEGTVGVSDDFGWFTAGRPGAYLFVGCGSKDLPVDLHQPDFDFDEAALLPVVAVADRIARTQLEGDR